LHATELRAAELRGQLALLQRLTAESQRPIMSSSDDTPDSVPMVADDARDDVRARPLGGAPKIEPGAMAVPAPGEHVSARSRNGDQEAGGQAGE